MKPKYNISKARSAKFGASLVTAITFCFGSTAYAVNNLWTGTVSADWNTAGNWSLNRVPTNANGATTGDTFDDAVVNTTTPNIATITANIPTPRDIIVGLNAGSVGRVDHTAGTAATGGDNWMFVGRNGGNGTYNLANPAGTGGALTGMGLGSGSVTVGRRLYVGGQTGTGSTGVFNVNTSGTLAIGTFLQLGTNNSTGTFNLDAGTVTAGTAGGDSWIEIGNGAGSTGFFNMSGGTFTKTGGQHFIVGANGATGTANISGGTVNINNEIWVANGAGSNGTLNLSGSGNIINNSWVAIGRENGTKGTVNMTGGTWTKTNGGNSFIIGASGPGEMTQSGGLLDVQGGDTWIGESSTATYTLSGATTEMRVNFLQVARNASSVATLNLNGGTLRANRIVGGAGTETINFNGTQIIAKVVEANFFADIQNAVIGELGLKIDSNAKNLGSTQIFTGSGGLTKSGVGTLTLASGQSYTGPTSITGGKLALSSSTTALGAVTVADGAGLGVTTAVDAEQLTVSNLTLGTSSGATVDFNLGDFAGNSTTAALNVTGSLARGGTVTLNVVDQQPEIGTIQLIKYVPGSLSGTGNFVLGTLPLGVVATLVNDTAAGLISLNVTSVKVLAWDGNISDQWDKVTQNWVNKANNSLSLYTDPNPVFFDDFARSNFDVKLNITVTPTLTTFDNSLALPYSLSGTGKISGSGGLTKSNTGVATITGLANDYTGTTSLKGGTLAVSNLGEATSSIGVASSDPSKLIFSGGTLQYTGASAVTTSRGLLIDAANNTIVSTLSSDANITIGGIFTTGSAANMSIGSFGQFSKAGSGTLTLTNPGPNILSAGGFRVAGGSLVLQGPNQTNSTGGLFLSPGTSVIQNSANLTNTGDVNIGDATGAAASWNLNGTSVYSGPNRIMTGINSATASGNITISDSASVTNNSWLSIGQTGSGTLTVKDSGKLTVGADFNISDLASSQGTYIQQGNAVVTGGTAFIGKGSGAIGNAIISGGTLTVGSTYIADSTETLVDGVQTVPPSQGTVTQSGGVANLAGDGGDVQIGSRGPGVWTMTGGTVNARGWNVIGRNPTVGASGTLNIGGTGVWNHLTAARNMIIGEETVGVVTVSDTGALTSVANTGIIISNSATGNGTLNINGGSVTAKQLRKGAGGVAVVNFNGGTLIAGAGALANFIAPEIDQLNINAGGATINTNGNNVAINRDLAAGATAGGGLTKTGAGTLTINGSAGYTGPTVISAGTLGGNVSFQGSLTVASGANANPGGPANGTIAGFGTVTFAAGSTLTIDAGATPDFLGSTDLVIAPGATLVVNGPLTEPTYEIGSYGTISGTFSTSIPGYTVDYSNNAIKLVSTGGNPYTTFIGTFFPGETNPAIVGPEADPDNDGSSNQVEFALGGTPNSGSSRPKVYTFVADSSDAGTANELLMTIAVRTGTNFNGGATATQDGATYTVQGSLNLTDFSSPVAEVTAVTTGLPAAPAGYEYRTFSLTASNGVANKGFLRVKVQ